MGSAFLLGFVIVKVAEKHGWTQRDRPGGNHPYVMEMPGRWCVPIRFKLKSRPEVLTILKQLGIPRSDWPPEVR